MSAAHDTLPPFPADQTDPAIHLFCPSCGHSFIADSHDIAPEGAPCCGNLEVEEDLGPSPAADFHARMCGAGDDWADDMVDG